MTDALQQKHCIACQVGTPPVSLDEVAKLKGQIDAGWEPVGGNKKIHREWKFKNFQEAMAFANIVAEIAEREGHHPDMYIFYNRVRLELWTHAANGLTENDFIMAAKIDSLT